MVNSVTIPETGEGYLFDKWKKPKKPNKSDIKYHYGFKNQFDEVRYNKDYSFYKNQLERYNNRTSDYLVPCAKNLLGKTFVFEPEKINVIFGENASGKTTLLKMMAGEALVTDGFTKLSDPLSLHSNSEKSVVTEKEKLKMNTSIIEWDGTPIYYHNFGYTEQQSCGIFGKLSGEILNGPAEELMYHYNKSRTSDGQHSMFFLDRLIKIASNPLCLKDILDPYISKLNRMNDVWQECYKVQYDYFSKYPMFSTKAPITMLFDELDKSLDIEKTWILYNKVLPAIVKEYKIQIIIISHNPLILTNEIFNNPAYKIISIDPEYTNKMKTMLKGISY